MIHRLLALSLFLVAQDTFVSSLDPCPQNRGLPDGADRAPNRNGDKPLYLLDVRKARDGFKPKEVYTFRITTTDKKRKFNDVTLSVESDDIRSETPCDTGSLLVDKTLHSPRGCPNVVATQEKQPMRRAYFKWRAPACGCVRIRAQVHSDGRYFIEDAYLTNGPLVQTVCPSAKYREETERPSEFEEAKRGDNTQDAREERLKTLCDVTADVSVTEAADVDSFIARRGLRGLSRGEREILAISLEQRKIDTERCCHQETQRYECFDDVRRRRIDSFCGSGQPDVPFTPNRVSWMKTREEDCCWRVGMARYACFNFTLTLEAMLKDEQESGPSIDQPLVSLDGLDPANDLEDYVSPRDGSRSMKAKPEKERVKKTGSRNSNIIEERESDAVNKEDHSKGRDDEEDDVDTKEKDDDIREEDDDIRDDDDAGKDTEVEDNTRQAGGQRHLGKEDCCLAGITAGTMVAAQGITGCYKMANEYEVLFTNWNKRCDRRFFVCCIQVIYGMSTSGSGLTPPMLAPTIGSLVNDERTESGNQRNHGGTSESEPAKGRRKGSFRPNRHRQRS